jgi:multicomponent Na+:H+ antiporter subunit F
MDKFLLAMSVALALTSLICLVRVIIGPTKGDRIIGINVVGTKTIVIIALIAFVLRETYFLDVVLVYALISFIASIFISREFAEESEEEDEQHA